MKYHHAISPRTAYYWSTAVKYAIVYRLKNREFSMLIPKWYKGEGKILRGRRCHNTQGLDFLRKFCKCDKEEKPHNLYNSVNEYVDGLPYRDMFDKELQHEWNKTHAAHIKGIDCFIDVDSISHDDIMGAHLSAKMIHVFLTSINCPHTIVFSGMGFHIIIPYKYFNMVSANEQLKLYKSIAIKFYNEFSELVDTSIYDLRRLKKIPFSIANYENALYVCYEFSSIEEFLNFRLDDYLIQNFDMTKIHNDTVIFNHDGNTIKLLKWLQE